MSEKAQKWHIPPDQESGFRERRRVHSSGAWIEMWDAKAPGNAFSIEKDEEGRDLRWITYCQDHEMLVQHRTRKAAESWIAAPESWCEECSAIVEERGRGWIQRPRFS